MTNITKKTTALFHIGRGGRFHNPGHKTLHGVNENLQDARKMEEDRLFLHERDFLDRFCKPFMSDCSGHIAMEDANAEVGVIDLDGDYDSWVAVFFDNLDEEELSLVMNEVREGRFTPSEEEWRQLLKASPYCATAGELLEYYGIEGGARSPETYEVRIQRGTLGAVYDFHKSL